MNEPTNRELGDILQRVLQRQNDIYAEVGSLRGEFATVMAEVERREPAPRDAVWIGAVSMCVAAVSSVLIAAAAVWLVATTFPARAALTPAAVAPASAYLQPQHGSP